ncbi:MAG: site-2 protease family protein [Holophagales bacterium]|nr:site-2 protease family protein [Holophagales bacterium]
MEMTGEALVLGLVWFVVFLFSTTLHEAAHAFVAHRLGDPTAYHGGQVSLSPVPHVAREPVGMVLVPIITYAMMGWMMGWASAPYNPLWADRYPRRAAWMALAGPVSNLLLVVVAGIVIRIGMALGTLEPASRITFQRVVDATAEGPWQGVAAFVGILFTLNLLLFAFNLIPLPPLDGASVLPLIMSEEKARAYQDFVRQPWFGLLGLVAAWNLFGQVFWPLMRLAIQVLYPEVSYDWG